MSKSLICQTSGKLRYATRRQALEARAARRQRTKSRKEARHQIPRECYRCDACGDWHLTKKVQPPKMRGLPRGAS